VTVSGVSVTDSTVTGSPTAGAPAAGRDATLPPSSGTVMSGERVGGDGGRVSRRRRPLAAGQASLLEEAEPEDGIGSLRVGATPLIEVEVDGATQTPRLPCC
jgi:hypothetical protein